ncbi:hypothetical protein Ahy_B05g078815 [Arachis hypogaea]|uniref:Uncharacterized protein n=1 Tax=Arachis hypogaea TaxID=3818 RepID=A0A444Z855_ARAHY|nr:hypothetical protein Ahy_B05g078815 [Arachis hypogaea]
MHDNAPRSDLYNSLDKRLRRFMYCCFEFGLELDVFVGSVFVSTYLKFALVVDAHEVFEELPVKSTTSHFSNSTASSTLGYSLHIRNLKLLSSTTLLQNQIHQMLFKTCACSLLAMTVYAIFYNYTHKTLTLTSSEVPTQIMETTHQTV